MYEWYTKPIPGMGNIARMPRVARKTNLLGKFAQACLNKKEIFFFQRKTNEQVFVVGILQKK